MSTQPFNARLASVRPLVRYVDEDQAVVEPNGVLRDRSPLVTPIHSDRKDPVTESGDAHPGRLELTPGKVTGRVSYPVSTPGL